MGQCPSTCRSAPVRNARRARQMPRVSHLIHWDCATGCLPSQSKGCGAPVSKRGARASGEGSLPAADWGAGRDASLRPMPVVSAGVSELRVKGADGVLRVFYYLAPPNGVLVFHAFVKKTQRTPPLEIEVARKRLKELPDA